MEGAGVITKVNHQSLLLGIVALTVVYQVAFHIAAGPRLEVPGVACPGGESIESDGQCTELRLFTEWREADSLLDEAVAEENDVVRTPHMAAEESDTVRTPHASIVTSIVSTHLTPWVAETDDFQDNLEARMVGLMSAQQRLATRQGAHAQENLPLLEQIMALGREMCKDSRRRERPTCSQFIEAPAAPEDRRQNYSDGTQGQQPLLSNSTDGMSANIESGRGNSASGNREAVLAERDANSEDEHGPSSASQGRQTFVSSAIDGPVASGSPSRTRGTRVNRTAERAEMITRLDAQRARLASNMKAWELELMHRIVDVGHSFCAEARRQGFSSCAPFLGGGAETGRAAAHNPDFSALAAKTEHPNRASRDTRRRLFWPPTALDSPQLRGGPAELANVRIEELRGAKWSAKIPMVACVMAIPATSRARAELRYAVDNFFLQSYEGPRQLILVHHAEDEQGRELARKYADGSYIKAVAARGDALPSAPALRYAAWSSDADVVAQWDVGARHHPDRLAMQVRALGLTRRPACALRRPTPEDSLVGEKGWMARHWYPAWSRDGEQQAAIEVRSPDSKERHVAFLDAPELLVRHEEEPRAAVVTDL